MQACWCERMLLSSILSQEKVIYKNSQHIVDHDWQKQTKSLSRKQVCRFFFLVFKLHCRQMSIGIWHQGGLVWVSLSKATSATRTGSLPALVVLHHCSLRPTGSHHFMVADLVLNRRRDVGSTVIGNANPPPIYSDNNLAVTAGSEPPEAWRTVRRPQLLGCTSSVDLKLADILCSYF